MEKARGSRIGTVTAVMPHTLPVVKLRAATTRKAMAGNTAGLRMGLTALMTKGAMPISVMPSCITKAKKMMATVGIMLQKPCIARSQNLVRDSFLRGM